MNTHEYKLAPSILAADFNCLGKQIKLLEEGNIEVLHIDVMDGIFVPSISFGMPLIASIRKESKLFFDVHLMIKEPIRYIDEFVEAGADSITIHVEACEDIKKTLIKIKESGVKSAISLNPSTELDTIIPYLDMVDMVLVMSVNPGFGGQKFIDNTLDKVDKLVEIRKSKNLCYNIEIDGGVNGDNISAIADRGVDILVAGTAIFKGDILNNIDKLRR